MKKRNRFYYFILAILIFLVTCSSTEEYQVLHQVTGGIHTNCYLIYGIKSKDAALIDVGGEIDTLLSYIKSNNLNLRYLLCTHGHFDHIIGIPVIKEQYPDAKIVIHEAEYKDMFTQKEWAEKNLGPEFIDYLLSDPERRKIYDFDLSTFGEPDIYIKNNQLLKFGLSEIKAIYSPGHSPGGMCYQLDNVIFSGDVLFYQTVGRTDGQNSSREDQINSVKRLYELLPADTKVYPGHGEFTDIGSEKKLNKYISDDGGEWVQ